MKKFLISLLAILIATPVWALPNGVTILTSPSQIKEFQILGQIGKTGEHGSYLYGIKKGQNLGSTNYVQTQFFTLSGSGVSSGATSVGLKTFHNIDGTNLTMTDFGSKGFGTIEPNNGTQEEQITFTGVTQNANGTATLTGVSTCLNKSPYTETSGVSVTHPGGVKFVISNTACFYNTFANKTNTESVSSTWTFFADPIASSSTHITGNPSAYVTLYAMNQATSTGGSNASTVVKGVVQEATDSMLQSSSSTGSTGARTYANGGSFAQSSTPNKAVVANGQGVIDPMWINTTSAYTWTGNHKFTTTTQATTTVTGLLTVPTPVNATDATTMNYVTSTLANATSSVMSGVSRYLYSTTTQFTTTTTNLAFTVVSTTLPANALGTQNLIHIHLDVTALNLNTSANVHLTLKYGGSTAADINPTNGGVVTASGAGVLDAYLYATGATNSQKGQINLLAPAAGVYRASQSEFINSIFSYAVGTSAIDDTTATSLSLTGQFSASNSNSNITVDHAYIEIIR